MGGRGAEKAPTAAGEEARRSAQRQEAAAAREGRVRCRRRRVGAPPSSLGAVAFMVEGIAVSPATFPVRQRGCAGRLLVSWIVLVQYLGV